jgi:hypothetical protein
MRRVPTPTKQKVGEWLESRLLEEDQPLSKEEIQQQADCKPLPPSDGADTDDETTPKPH